MNILQVLLGEEIVLFGDERYQESGKTGRGIALGFSREYKNPVRGREWISEQTLFNVLFLHLLAVFINLKIKTINLYAFTR